MYKLRTLLIYSIIAALFVVAISAVNPVMVNATDEDEPYLSYIKEPMKK